MKFHTPFVLPLRTILLLLLAALLCPQAAMATGPRVSASLFASHANSIYALDLPPFIGSEHPGGGLSAEIVNAAMVAGQVDYALTSLPLQSMLKYYLLQENALAVLGRDLSLSVEQKAGLILVPLFISDEAYWYHRPSQAQPLAWNGKLASLAGRTYGALRGEEVDAYQRAGIKLDYGSSKGLLQKLISGKLDFIRLPDLTIDWLLQRHFPQQRASLAKLEPEIGAVPLYIAFNRKHPAGDTIAAKFRQGLMQMVADGRYLEILQRHLGKAPENQERVQRLQHHLLAK